MTQIIFAFGISLCVFFAAFLFVAIRQIDREVDEETAIDFCALEGDLNKDVQDINHGGKK